MQNDQIWYVYQEKQQLGPFTSPQVVQLIQTRLVKPEAFLFKVGWKDWRPMEETLIELGLPSASPESSKERRKLAPRASVSGQVVVHNNGKLTIGEGVNISSTGIFVETKEQMFTVGEKLKLTVKAKGLKKSFHVTAQVVRFNSDTRYPVGYGLMFEALSQEVAEDIQALVDAQNARLLGSSRVGSR